MMEKVKAKIKKFREGFTIAELLVVVAIIAVMVAIAIPVFGSAAERAKVGTALANTRGAYAKAMTEAIAEGKTSGIELTIAKSNLALPSKTYAVGFASTDANKKITIKYGSASNTATAKESFAVDPAVKKVTIS